MPMLMLHCGRQGWSFAPFPRKFWSRCSPLALLYLRRWNCKLPSTFCCWGPPLTIWPRFRTIRASWFPCLQESYPEAALFLLSSCPLSRWIFDAILPTFSSAPCLPTDRSADRLVGFIRIWSLCGKLLRFVFLRVKKRRVTSFCLIVSTLRIVFTLWS